MLRPSCPSSEPNRSSNSPPSHCSDAAISACVTGTARASRRRDRPRIAQRHLELLRRLEWPRAPAVNKRGAVGCHRVPRRNATEPASIPPSSFTRPTIQEGRASRQSRPPPLSRCRGAAGGGANEVAADAPTSAAAARSRSRSAGRSSTAPARQSAPAEGMRSRGSLRALSPGGPRHAMAGRDRPLPRSRANATKDLPCTASRPPWRDRPERRSRVLPAPESAAWTCS